MMILSQFWTQIQVFARDLNGYDVIDPSTIEIYVTDINDNPPIFDQESYVGQVAEHSPPGTRRTVRNLLNSFIEPISGTQPYNSWTITSIIITVSYEIYHVII